MNEDKKFNDSTSESSQTTTPTGKRRKAVTKLVFAANRANSEKSPGPNDTSRTRFNAVKRGVLARNVQFRNEDEAQSYAALLEKLSKYHEPVGPSEEEAVEEMALCEMRLGIVYEWEFEQVAKRRKASESILRSIGEESDAYRVVRETTDQGWEAEEVVFRNGSRKREEPDGLGEVFYQAGHNVVETRVANPMNLILRYGAAIRRDYSQALSRLSALQRERFEREALRPISQEVKSE